MKALHFTAGFNRRSYCGWLPLFEDFGYKRNYSLDLFLDNPDKNVKAFGLNIRRIIDTNKVNEGLNSLVYP